jgi:hypothetical protein
MNFAESISNINYFAVIVAAIVAMAIGALWYSPALFANAWMKENGFSRERMKGRNPLITMFSALILTIIMAFNLALFLLGPSDVVWGMTAGALASIGWISLSLGITYLFEGKSIKLWLINSGYSVVTFIVMGAIIGGWK